MQTILIVEDEKTMRDVLAERLSHEGFRVLQADNGESGLDTALHEKPDLILLDNRMPNMSGYAMLRKLREYDSWGEKVPVIFFSNVEPASREEREDLDAIAPTDYLIKADTDLSQVAQKIRSVLGTE